MYQSAISFQRSTFNVIKLLLYIHDVRMFQTMTEFRIKEEMRLISYVVV